MNTLLLDFLLVTSDVEVDEQKKDRTDCALPEVYDAWRIAAVLEHRDGEMREHEEELNDLDFGQMRLPPQVLLNLGAEC